MNLALIKQVAEFKAILGAQRAKLISFQLDSLDAKSVHSGKTSTPKTRTRKTSSTAIANTKRLLKTEAAVAIMGDLQVAVTRMEQMEGQTDQEMSQVTE